jgi:hypothetical protein
MIAAEHSILIVEDDAPTAKCRVEFVRSLGMSSRVAGSLDEIDVQSRKG